MPRHRREVEHRRHHVVRGSAPAQEAHDGVVRVGHVDPREPGRVEVQLVQRLLLSQHAVQVPEPQAQPAVHRVVEQVPVERLLDVPLAPLAELATHEQQLLARLRVHPAVQQPQVGELLPLVARHLRDERALAVHHLVVREREHEVLTERIEHSKRQVGMVELAMHGLALKVVERVVHPAHVPFHAEAKASDIGGT